MSGLDIATLLLVAAVVLIIPLAIFIGLISLGILIWSWKRIGPYFVSFGRWVADWRNFIPLGCLGILAIVAIVLFAAVLPDELSLLRVLLLGLVGIVGFVFTLFAVLLWVIRFIAWLWPRFRREFWLNLQRLWDFLWGSMSGQRRAVARPATGSRRPPPKKQTETGAQLPAAQAASAAGRPAARAAPPQRQSRFGVSWLWAAVWGRPQQPVIKPKASPKVIEGGGQAGAGVEAIRPPRVPASRKTGIRPLLWRLGLSGARPAGRKTPGKVPPAVVGSDATRDSSSVPGSSVVNQPQSGVARPVIRAADARQKPSVVAGRKPRRGLSATAGAFWHAMGNRVESVRRGFWVGVFWTGRKARAGIDYTLRLLHLGGKRK